VGGFGWRDGGVRRLMRMSCFECIERRRVKMHCDGMLLVQERCYKTLAILSNPRR
jgi:hypothetical protein